MSTQTRTRKCAWAVRSMCVTSDQVTHIFNRSVDAVEVQVAIKRAVEFAQAELRRGSPLTIIEVQVTARLLGAQRGF